MRSLLHQTPSRRAPAVLRVPSAVADDEFNLIVSPAHSKTADAAIEDIGS